MYFSKAHDAKIHCFSDADPRCVEFSAKVIFTEIFAGGVAARPGPGDTLLQARMDSGDWAVKPPLSDSVGATE